MSKSWTSEELAAASAAMKAEGHMSYEEFCAAPVLRLEHRGRDSWGRPRERDVVDGPPGPAQKGWMT